MSEHDLNIVVKGLKPYPMAVRVVVVLLMVASASVVFLNTNFSSSTITFGSPGLLIVSVIILLGLIGFITIGNTRFNDFNKSKLIEEIVNDKIKVIESVKKEYKVYKEKYEDIIRGNTYIEELFSMSEAVEQTMITPKLIRLESDSALREYEGRKWVERNSRLTRVYGINNSLELESAKMFYEEIRKLNMPDVDVDIKLVDMIELDRTLRGMFTNVTKAISGEGEEARYILSCPYVVNKSTGRPSLIAIDNDHFRNYSQLIFDFWYEQGESYDATYESLKRNLHKYNKKLVVNSLRSALRKVEGEVGSQFSAALMGSILDDHNIDWLHRDIDVLVMVRQNTEMSKVRHMQTLIQAELQQLGSEARKIEIVFLDGPVKISPSERKEVWQFHVIFDTLENMLDWPVHVVQRRKNNLVWLKNPSNDEIEDINRSFSNIYPIEEACNSIINGGFGVNMCMNIFNSSMYTYKELETGSSKLIRTKKEKKVLFGGSDSERIWRKCYMTRYGIYNSIFNMLILLKYKVGAHYEERGEISFGGICREIEELYANSNIKIIEDAYSKIDALYKELRHEYIYGVILKDDNNLYKRYDNRIDEIKLSVTTTLRDYIRKGVGS